jgi:hypothetical protein
MADPEQESFDPTEKVMRFFVDLDDHWGTWNDRVFICGNGQKKGIGISDGCNGVVRPIKDWLGLDKRIVELEKKNTEYMERTHIAESRLAKAVEMLEEVAGRDCVHASVMSRGETMLGCTCLYCDARRVLAELGEEK